tara:strand:+ start:416 stop:550 length:135 start_codon:yes stop_codon:yes gene_type:complete
MKIVFINLLPDLLKKLYLPIMDLEKSPNIAPYMRASIEVESEYG